MRALFHIGGWGGGVVAALTAACCVLPMALMLAGVGTSFMWIFARGAAISPYIAGLAVLLNVVGWVVATRRGAAASVRAGLTIGSVLSLVAILLILGEGRVNDLLLTLM